MAEKNPLPPHAFGTSALPPQDTSKSSKEQGLYEKYRVSRTDGSDFPGGKHDGCEYFVLDITHDPAAKLALATYAGAVRATHPQLAREIMARYFNYEAT